MNYKIITDSTAGLTKEIIDIHIPNKDVESIIKYLILFGIITVIMVLAQ